MANTNNTILRHILLVDDESDIRAVAQLALEAIGGFQISTFSSGKQAVEGVHDVKPDLILLDVMMPGITGPETLSILKANDDTADIPVIFMTAKVQKHEVAEYCELGALGVIAKPFNPMELASQVTEYWEGRNAA